MLYRARTDDVDLEYVHNGHVDNNRKSCTRVCRYITAVVNLDHNHSHGLDESKILSQMTSFADRLRV